MSKYQLAKDGVMLEALIQELKDNAGLSDEQARKSVEIFERYIKQGPESSSGGTGEEFHGLFSGSERLFEERG